MGFTEGQMNLMTKPFTSTPLEWFFVANNLIIGCFLLLPIDTYGNVKGMGLFEHLMPENCLAMVFVVLGGFHWWSLATRRCFACVLSASSAWWGFVGIATMIAQPYSSRPLEAMAIAVAHLLIVWRGVRYE